MLLCLQVGKIVGRSAPEEFISQLTDLANTHHKDMFLDVMRAYHFGARWVVWLRIDVVQMIWVLMFKPQCWEGALKGEGRRAWRGGFA